MLFAHADWLAQRWLARYYSPPSSWRKTKWLLVSKKVTAKQVKLFFGPLVILLVWYILKTIIHLSVGEIGGYFPPLWWIIVKYFKFVRFILNVEIRVLASFTFGVSCSILRRALLLLKGCLKSKRYYCYINISGIIAVNNTLTFFLQIIIISTPLPPFHTS